MKSGGDPVQFEVFVMPRMKGSLKELKKNETMTSGILFSMIDQLLEMNEVLKTKKMNHNDVKPGNVLYEKVTTNNGLVEIRLKLADFGMCGRLGGTPGWSPPDFTHDRQPGSDEYSFGLVALFLLAEDDDLFYVLRDNYTTDIPHPQWLIRFRNLPEIKVIQNMMNPNYKQSSKPAWARLRSTVQMITRQRLAPFRIPNEYLTLQDGSTVQDKNE